MEQIITYRNIAKMLASALPIEGQEFGLRVEQNLTDLMAMNKEAKNALRSAYIFSRKVPKQERADLFQDMALAILKAKIGDEKLAYAVARCDWMNWWQKFTIRQHFSLDSVVNDDTGNPVTLAELIVGEVEFEAKMISKIEAQRLRNLLPSGIRKLVDRRLIAQSLGKLDRECLQRWSSKNVALLMT